MELMVVVAILGVLIALVLPVANGLQSASQAAVEQSAARGLVGAWRSWSMDHQGQLIPGQTAMDTPLSPSEAPVIWNNTPIPEIARRRWIWRLLPWMDSPKDSLWVGDQASFWENTIANAPDHVGVVDGAGSGGTGPQVAALVEWTAAVGAAAS